MAEYTYEGIDKNGKRISGKLEASGEGELRMALRSQGIRPTRLGRGTGLNSQMNNLMRGSGVRIPAELVVTFTRQLHLLISSGVPLMQGIDLLLEQTQHQGYRGILLGIRDKVSQGSYLWEAMAPYPQVFPKLYVALVRAGESSGSLDQMLRRLVKYLEDSERVKRMVKSAMMYPIIVTLIGIGVVTLLLVFVIPKFEDLLKGSGQQLPALTQFVIDMSQFLIHNAIFLIFGITAGVYLLLRYVRSPEGRAVMDRLLFRLPMFGDMMKKAGIARFTRTMQTLLVSGVNMIDAIDICRATIDNAVLEKAVLKIRSEVESGKTLGMVLSKIPVFPRMAVQMILVGESTGNLDKMLEKVADFYEQEVEILVGGLSKLMEPLILVVLGGAVGGLMLAMYLPIFKLAGGAE